MSGYSSSSPGTESNVSIETVIHQARQLDAVGRAQVVSCLMGGPVPLQAVPTAADQISQQIQSLPPQELAQVLRAIAQQLRA